MRRTVKGLSRMALLALVLALGGCKVELYTGISQKEGNEMLALLRSEGVSADKQADKDGTVRLLVEESDIAEAVEVLKRKGYPRENFSTLKDVFPKDGLISSPIEERARLNYAKAQEISHTLSEIDGVLVARVHVVLPEERDGLGRKSSPASASVFIKHAADVQLDAYVPQIKQLVNNGIEGLSYDRISVVLVPSAGVRQVPLAPRFECLLDPGGGALARTPARSVRPAAGVAAGEQPGAVLLAPATGLSGAMPLTAYQLRFCPARYIHESHLPAVLLRLLPALPDWRRQSVLNAWLLEQLELDCAFRMPAQLGGLAFTRRRRWNGPWAGSARCCTARPCGRCWTVRGYGASARRSANRASVSAWNSSTCSSVAGRPAGSGPCRKTRKTAISGAAAWLSGWPPVAMPTAVSRGACACAWRPCRPRRTGPSTNNGDPWRGPCA